MKPSLVKALEDASDALDEIFTGIEKTKMPDLIDIAARLRGISKTAEKVDTYVKDAIKERRTVDDEIKPGEVKGEVFKAIITLVPVDLLDQKLLKEKYPKTHKACLKSIKQTRISFEAR